MPGKRQEKNKNQRQRIIIIKIVDLNPTISNITLNTSGLTHQVKDRHCETEF